MRLLAGTSGYSFKEWKGTFYPAELKSDQLLGFYATKFPTLEINSKHDEGVGSGPPAVEAFVRGGQA